jgi:hypothetical protein
MSVLAVLVHDGVLMTCRALSIALSHTFFKRTQSSAHQVQPLSYVVIEQGLEAFIHILSAFIVVYMCGLRILSLGFLEILFFSQAVSHASKAATALRALVSAVSLELSLNQVLQPVQHAPDDWCAVCFEPLGVGSQHDSDAAAAAAATAAALGGCVRLPCNHCFHKANFFYFFILCLFPLLTYSSVLAALHGCVVAQESGVSHLQSQRVACTGEWHPVSFSPYASCSCGGWRRRSRSSRST